MKKLLFLFLIISGIAFAQPPIAQPADMSVCDVNENGFGAFDLTANNDQILDGLNASLFEIKFYNSLSNAVADSDFITAPTAYTSSSNPETIFVRVHEIADTANYATISFNLVANPLPVFTLNDVSACEGTVVELNSGLTGAYLYQWFYATTAIAGANGSNLFVTEAGPYSMTATTAAGCVYSDEALVTFIPSPVASVSGPAFVSSGEGVSLTFIGTPNATVQFTLTIDNTPTPLIVVLDPTGNGELALPPFTTNATVCLTSVSLNSCSTILTNCKTVLVGTEGIVNIPDANFKGILLNASTSNNIATDSNHFAITIDANGDGEIQLSEALQVYQLRILESNISDLTGIENFSNLANLNCSYNQLTSLSILNTLLSLTTLTCNNNQLTTLDISSLNSLTQLRCNNNLITSAFLNLNDNLILLDCSNNPLGNLNVGTLTNLEILLCNSISLSSLDVSNLSTLHTLHCNSNSLTSLNVSTLLNLKNLDFSDNAINTINISPLVNLEYLSCSQNGLTSLDVSSLTNLIELNCHINEITSLNLSVLTNLEKLQIQNNLFNSIDFIGLNNLKFLSCNNNLFTSLDVSVLANLEHLNYGNSGLGNIDVGNLTNLKFLSAYNLNQLPTNMGNLQNLEDLIIVMSAITEIDASNLSALNSFYSGNNNLLTYVNLKNGNDFTASGISFSANPNLIFVCVNNDDINKVYSLGNDNGDFNVNSYCSFSPGGNYNIITGSMIFDSNSNGCDASDVLQPNIKININDGTNQGATFTNNSGNYSFFTQTGSFTLNPDVENPSWFNFSPPSAVIPFVNNNNNVITQNFCITANGVHSDLEVVIVPIIPARPGFDAVYKIVYKNKGNQGETGYVNFTYNDSVLDFISSSIVPNNNGGGFMNWVIPNIAPFQVGSILVTLNVNSPQETPAVNIGDVLAFNAFIDVSIDDIWADNNFDFNQTVVGSYDPNDVTCLEGNSLPTTDIGKYLHYNIRFENTGTATAENIVVKNVIDLTQYNIETLQIMESSHPMKVKVTGNIAEFIFEAIYLDTGGHGNILLKLKSNATISENEVTNNAGIYFDYNFPVATNDEETVFGDLSKNNFTKDPSVQVYPNPTANVITVKAANTINSIELYDVQGRLLSTTLLNENSKTIDLSNYSAGVYFVNVTTVVGKETHRILKK
jgi:uncharacterized repeat protein (TIGR01451 family)